MATRTKTRRPVSPLERALRARRTMIARIGGCCAAIALGSAGIVAPAISSHHRASAELESTIEAASESLHHSAAVLAFRNRGLPRLERALDELERVAPGEPLPPDHRARLHARLSDLGIEPTRIEIRDLRYLWERDEHDPEPALVATPITVEFLAPGDRIDRAIRALIDGDRPGVLTRLELSRPDGSLDRLQATVEFLVLHQNPAFDPEREDEHEEP